MKMSKELADKLRKVLEDQDEICPWTVSAEVLASIMENEDQTNIFVTQKNFVDALIKKFNEQLEEGNIVTAADFFESLGFERESAPDIEFESPKKIGKPMHKIYTDLAYGSAMEATRCHMLIDKLQATIELLDAQQKYYEKMSIIERDNEMFGFDLSI